MKKQLSVAASVLAAGLLGLGGCGGSSDSCRLDVQRDLDQGNYDAVIAALEPANSSCRSEYPNNNYYLDLTAAYMGKAGVGVSDFVKIAIDSSTANDAFKTFVQGIGKKTQTSALTTLATAKGTIKSFNGDQDLNCTKAAQQNYSYLVKDACLYTGIIGTIKASVSISAMTTDVEAWIENSATGSNDVNGNGVPDDMDAASCAFDYALNGTTGSPFSCADNVNVTAPQNPVTFDNNNTYESIKLQVVGIGAYVGTNNEYFKLVTTGTGASAVVTDGNCTVAFADCPTANGTDCFACPVNRESGADNEITLTDTIVDGLNNGIDSIAGSVDANSELSGDIEQLKKKIDTTAPCREISTQEVIEYMQDNQATNNCGSYYN